METSKLINTLRFCGNAESCCSKCPSGDQVTELSATECMCDLMQKAATAIEALQAERDAMVAELKHDQGCAGCVHYDIEWCKEPCDSCRQDPKFPAWKWRGRS